MKKTIFGMQARDWESTPGQIPTPYYSWLNWMRFAAAERPSNYRLPDDFINNPDISYQPQFSSLYLQYQLTATDINSVHFMPRIRLPLAVQRYLRELILDLSFMGFMSYCDY